MVILHNFPVETVVGSHLQAAVTMKAENGAFFYRCDAFNSLIKWKAGSESFVIVNATQELLYLETVPNTQLHSSADGSPCSSPAPAVSFINAPSSFYTLRSWSCTSP
ncbi:hypothetical protein Fmac_016951 [Flemingia macrophylla]|uniref:Uncharacterized protein n=1 Tax=Flemingia macrophylla TaxID=520843 RepID=A0ABD1MIX2_9FABA